MFGGRRLLKLSDNAEKELLSKSSNVLTKLRKYVIMQCSYTKALLNGSIDVLVETGKLDHVGKSLIIDELNRGINKPYVDKDDKINEHGYPEEEWEAMYPNGDDVLDYDSWIRYSEKIEAIIDEETIEYTEMIDNIEYNDIVKELYEVTGLNIYKHLNVGEKYSDDDYHKLYSFRADLRGVIGLFNILGVVKPPISSIAEVISYKKVYT